MSTPRRACAMAAAFVLAAAPASAQPVFPPAGADSFDSEMSVELDALGSQRTVTLRGPTTVLRSAPQSGGDGHRFIDTEIVAMDLRGTDPVFGVIRVRVNPERSSVGRVTAQGMSADFPADSHFDVFVLVTVPGLASDLMNVVPVRVETQGLEGLPPVFKTYTHPPPAIPLVLASNPGGGTVATIGGGSTHRPEQRPTFSVAPGSTLDPADLHEIGNPPVVVLTRAGLGLQTGDDVNALSFGRDVFVSKEETSVAFSVDPASDGVPGSAVSQQAAGGEAQGDEFVTYFNASNQLLVDEQALVLAPSHDLDALTNQEAALVDANGDQIPDQPVFFSLTPGSPTLAALGASPGDILVSVGGNVSVFAPRAALGLVPGDDLDALCLLKAGLPFTVLRPGPGPPGPPSQPGDANFDHALFSLAPGSPSLASQGFSAADLLVTDFSSSRLPLAGTPPALYAAANDMGLLPTDDLDALKCLTPVSFLEVDGGGDTDGPGNGTGCAPNETVQTGVVLDSGGPNSGDPFAPPGDPGEISFFEMWTIQNPHAGDYHGPYAYPGSEAGLFFLELDPALEVTWSGNPNVYCGLLHVHGPFGFPDDLFGFHQDPDVFACGHGIFIPAPYPIAVIPTRRDEVPVVSQDLIDFLDALTDGRFSASWHLYSGPSTIPTPTSCSPALFPRTVLVFQGLLALHVNLLLRAPLPPTTAGGGQGEPPIAPPVRVGPPLATLSVPLLTPEPGAALAAGAAVAALAALSARRRRR